jgi:mono/diheme cytochrome c family protein
MMRRWLVIVLALAVGGVSWSARTWAAEGKTPAGQAVFIKYRCRSCHTIEALGIEKKVAEGEEEEPTPKKKKPPDLSGVGLKHNAAWMTGWLLKKETIEGEHHMKKFRGTQKELATLTAWLETMKTKKAGKSEKATGADKASGAEKAEPADSVQKTE